MMAYPTWSLFPARALPSGWIRLVPTNRADVGQSNPSSVLFPFHGEPAQHDCGQLKKVSDGRCALPLSSARAAPSTFQENAAPPQARCRRSDYWRRRRWARRGLKSCSRRSPTPLKSLAEIGKKEAHRSRQFHCYGFLAGAAFVTRAAGAELTKLSFSGPFPWICSTVSPPH